MKEGEYREFLVGRGLDEGRIGDAVDAVREFERELSVKDRSIDSATVEEVKEHIALLVSRGENSMERLRALSWYFYATRMNDIYVYFTSILQGRTILESISERLTSLVDEETSRRVFEGIEMPPLGSPPEAVPEVTARFMERLECELPQEVYRRVLAGNHHRIPLEAFDGLKEMYKEAESIDEFLKWKHEDAIKVLEEHLEEGRAWYEQEITPRVVEFVKGNQEVLGGVRHGDKIYMTKIPYNPDAYVGEEDPLMKRYYACHCPLARAAILAGEPEVNPEWCYCSGGYGKLLFDLIFEEETEVEILENALAGDMRCRFTVKIPEGKHK